MRRALALLVPPLVLVPAAPAAAVWVPAERAAGPSRIVRVGDAALGADGTGAVSYVGRVGDKRHHDRDRVGYVVRLRGGHWERPVRLARGGVDDIRVAAGTDGRLAVAWIAGGSVFATVSGHGAAVAPVQLGAGDASHLDLRLGDDGNGYAVWTADGAGGRDVRAARLSGNSWTPLPGPLDADPNRSAGAGAGRARVVVRPDGEGVAAWGETYPDGSTHVFARRLPGTEAPPAAVEVGVAALGAEAGGSADSPELDAESGPEAVWIAFRQDIGGRSRSLARRMTNAGLAAPVALDGGATSRNPAIAVGGENGGIAAAAGADGTVVAALLAPGGTFAAPVRVDPAASGSPQNPVAAWAAARGEGAVAFRAPGPGDKAAVFGRLAEQGSDLGSQTRLSRRGAGPVVGGSLRLGAAPAGDALVAMLQGDRSDHRRLTVALADRAPEPPRVRGGWVAGPRPRLRWTPGVEALGRQRFHVELDGRRIGTTRGSSLRAPADVDDGRHRVRVIAVDHRGQRTAAPRRTIRVDSTRPELTVTAHRSGRTLRLTVKRGDKDSGIDSIEVRWGDGKRSSARRGPFRHRYERRGARRVRVTVRDRAGNRTVRRLKA